MKISLLAALSEELDSLLITCHSLSVIELLVDLQSWGRLHHLIGGPQERTMESIEHGLMKKKSRRSIFGAGEPFKNRK